MKRLSTGMLISCLLHAGLLGAALGFIAWQNAHADQFVNIDLRGTSLLRRPKHALTGRPPVPSAPWLLSLRGKAAPPPPPAPHPVTRTPEVETETVSLPPPCPPPCPSDPGDWIPASNASRVPEWVDGMITEDDYPMDMRSQKKQGVVVVDVLIDTAGVVRGVSLVQGSDPEFNTLVLERLEHSRFQPAYNAAGKPIACRARMPIAFELH